MFKTDRLQDGLLVDIKWTSQRNRSSPHKNLCLDQRLLTRSWVQTHSVLACSSPGPVGTRTGRAGTRQYHPSEASLGGRQRGGDGRTREGGREGQLRGNIRPSSGENREQKKVFTALIRANYKTLHQQFGEEPSLLMFSVFCDSKGLRYKQAETTWKKNYKKNSFLDELFFFFCELSWHHSAACSAGRRLSWWLSFYQPDGFGEKRKKILQPRCPSC